MYSTLWCILAKLTACMKKNANPDTVLNTKFPTSVIIFYSHSAKERLQLSVLERRQPKILRPEIFQRRQQLRGLRGGRGVRVPARRGVRDQDALHPGGRGRAHAAVGVLEDEAGGGGGGGREAGGGQQEDVWRENEWRKIIASFFSVLRVSYYVLPMYILRTVMGAFFVIMHVTKQHRLFEEHGVFL